MQRLNDGVGREVGDDTQPADEHPACGVESGLSQRRAELIVLEVDRRPREFGGSRHAERCDALTLPRLCRGLVDLEDADTLGLAPRERVETRAEDHVLLGGAGGEPVLGEPRARCYPHADWYHVEITQQFASFRQDRFRVGSSERPGQPISKQRTWPVVQQMRCARHRGDHRSATRHSGLGGARPRHDRSLSARNALWQAIDTPSYDRRSGLHRLVVA